MNILFACHRLPFPPNRGGKIRPFHMIQHLGRRHSVTVASLAHSREELEQGAGLKDYCAEVIAEVLPNHLRWRQAVAALATTAPSSLAYFRSHELLRRLREKAAACRFDAVLVHCAFAAQHVTGISAPLRVLDYGDLDSGKWSDYSKYRAFPLSVGYGLEAAKLRRHEKWLAGQFDRCTVTTTGEWEQFQTLGVSTPCAVIPNGVDFSYFQASTSKTSDSPVLVFLGRMDYFPNVDGVVRFVREIFPLVRHRRPAARLLIVGSNPSRSVRQLARVPGVEVTGFVPDVRPYLEKAAVAVAPIHLARGTQNKILEAMSAGVPVVSTPEAAKGIRGAAGRDLLVGGTREEFASQVLRLLEDPVLRGEMAAAARRKIEATHSWPHSMQLLDAVLGGSPVSPPREFSTV